MRSFLHAALLALSLAAAPAYAQDATDLATPAGTISVADIGATDLAILNRIGSILAQLPEFDGIKAEVDAGIVTLDGEVAEQDAIDRLLGLIGRVDGVVSIRNEVHPSTDLATRLETVRARFQSRMTAVVAGLPFVALGLLVGSVIVLLGGWLSRREKTLTHIAPNPFIAGFLAQAIRLIAWIVALVVALDLMGARALLGTLLGAAGIFGLSLSFAARDTIEGFVATMLLSLRQPFNPNDLIEVNGLRGRVIRLTSRGTTLLTLDGNHIRIPNQIIYKAVLTNFTRNPERRFMVDITLDPAADLGRARDLALKTLGGMDFVMKRPEPIAWLDAAGPEHLILRAGGWVSQEGTDFELARGEAFRLLHHALDAKGFLPPELVHRIQIEQPDASPLAAAQHRVRPADPRLRDVGPDAAFEEIIERERVDDGRDLLTPSR
ncbi:mechanosensitive ion channel [Paracoccus sp. 1_MG-2023]|uniref:mechanosensitive ion channel domain-containing protein n=1 Tax=unclassified Paracoccus (in: a-proteobacteria) TaxID=2688777 RepID=UPI001C08B3CF|nr:MULTISPECIES: mechanosensitive ion channel domain-containing protein [unclassified Paracoccus (in: a-proteobacteria)]MDO6670410.1 mechanosensitive ion channel [Paracoccus sp. 1_MG-2023]